MADSTTLRKRTIQHPGFEFFETDLSKYRQYEQDTDALIVGYFAKGPINTPVAIKNLNDYSVYFGTPESEAEVYFYKGIEAVLTAGGTVTAVRLPYDNTTSAVTSEGTEVQYKALTGSFKNIEKPLPEELNNAYKGGATFKNIEFKQDVINQAELTSIIGGTSDDDFAIINKYNDAVSSKGNEIFVTVLGAGNAIKHQGLNVESDVDIVVCKKYVTEYPKAAVVYDKSSDPVVDEHSDPVKDAFGRDTYSKVVVDPENAGQDMYVKVNSITDEYTGITTYEITNEPAFEVYSDGSFVYYKVGEDGKVTDEKVETSYPSLYKDGSGKAFTAENADGDLFSRESLKWQSSGDIDEFGNLLTVADSFDSSIASWFPTIPTYAEVTEEGDKIYIDPRKDDQILVIVSKIKPSTLESGKFNIEIAETFSGSIFKGSIDPISNESNYIGDIINNSSSYISFYGKERYDGYDKEEDTIYVQGLEALRFSWADGCKATKTSSDTTSLKKVFVKAEKAEDIDYVKSVLQPALKKTKNSIQFLYRDVYDCGLSSVIAYMEGATDGDVKNGLALKPGDLIYKPGLTNPTETTSSSFLNASKWRKVVYAFARHCQYNHKLSMFHADGPRKLCLNGNLSRADDLFQDQMDVVFTAKKVQSVAIKDNTYCQVNTNWYEIQDEFNKTMMWLPNSVILAGDITYNDIYSNVWEAPAGRVNGLVKNVVRPAFNPEYETMDRLYLNCLNYATKWPTGEITVEGQKTSYAEESALNRINVRRLLIWLERWTQKVAANYQYVPNNSDNRSAFQAEVEQEFSRIFTLGGLNAYRVVCDENNNPGEIQDRNEMRITCMVQPTRTTEFIIANFMITKTGVNLEELSPVF